MLQTVVGVAARTGVATGLANRCADEATFCFEWIVDAQTQDFTAHSAAGLTMPHLATGG